MSISENILKIRQEIPETVCLVAVSKTKPSSAILEAYGVGQRIFGENKVQELCSKQAELPKDIQWHFIGHLQTNKVKYIAPFVSLIHSVDSLKLMQEINKEAQKNNRIIHCLLEFHIATEESKFGLNYQEARALLTSAEYAGMENISIDGVMGMASFTDDAKTIHKEFQGLSHIYQELKTEFFSNQEHFGIISMGMSDDYPIAIQEGSTMVRVGSSIFGKR
ncbi:MAG: YggS family pyridoxal phosphate-dependent enzyme [Bacteroidota bacterium]|nr:YggS family pyridoxal phosphate-dependent enzyme [Bacteroidota bacterium]